MNPCVTQGGGFHRKTISPSPSAPVPPIRPSRITQPLYVGQEEVLKRPDIQVHPLEPTNNSEASRHRAMRASSLICGKPEAIDVSSRCPSLLHNLVSSSHAGRQAHVSWDRWGTAEHELGLTRIIKARLVASMGAGDEMVRVFRVDPEGWPSRERVALEGLRFYALQRTLTRFNKPLALREEQSVERTLEGIGRVLKAARRHRQDAVFVDFAWP